MSNPIERKRMWLDAFRNTMKRPALNIEKTVKALEVYEIEKALRETLETKKLKTKLERRQEKLNAHFVWTPEKVEKLRNFNDKMWFRYKEAYDEVCRLKKEFDERFANGDKNYASYDIRTEFWYNCEDGLPEKEEKLWEDLCEESVFWGPEFAEITGRAPLKSFEEEMLDDGHSWNEYPFNTPELDGICLHYFMHDIFNHNHTYSLEDLMQMKPENFSWQVNICLEHWGKSVEKKKGKNMLKFRHGKQEELSEKETEKVNKKFNSFKNKSYSEENMHKVFDNEEKILNMMKDKNLKQFIEDVKLFFCMLKDYFTRKYTEVPTGTIMAIAGTLLYVLNPFDLIPDFIPVIGKLDDAAVIALCMNFVKVDLEKYKKFKGL